MKKTIILVILFLGKILSAQNFEVVVGKKLEKKKKKYQQNRGSFGSND